jgi:hypothetical protein
MNFQNQCSGIEASHAWPGESIKCGGHGSVSRGDKRGSWRDRRWTGSDYVSKHGSSTPIVNQALAHLQARVLP